MRKSLITHFMLGAAILSFVLTGCSSGKVGSSDAPSQSVSGVAASGAPIVGAIVFLQDSSSPAQVRTATTADNGAFTVDASGLVAPYLLRVEWTDYAGPNKMYAFAEQAGTTNINPFSNVAFAVAVGISDQVALAANFDPAMYRSVASRHEAACDNLRTALGPLFELFQTSKDPVTDAFNADHTGLDALFDNVKIFVNNGMIVVTNKDPYRLIFKGPIDNITAGTFYPQNMPNVAVTGGGAGGGAINGAALYGQYCAGCHNPLASSTHQGATASDILAGIQSQNGMKSLSILTSAQIDAIAAALATTPTTPPPSGGAGGGTIDGAALYQTYCARCHNPLASSNHRGATSSDILRGISNQSGMKSLSILTSAQIDAIAAALVMTSTTPPPGGGAGGGAIDGAALYGQYCATCHNPLASSTHRGATSSDILRGISNQSGMRSLSVLTSAQIDAIAAALATTSTTPPPPATCGSCHTIPPATGQHDLHVNSQGLSCGTCHGTGYSKTTVNAATHMNGVTNIASGSTPGWNPTTRSCSNSCHGTHSWGGTASTTPPPSGGTGGGAIDGAALYGQYCQTCHGALASSTHRGATSSDILRGISNQSGMRSLSVLTSAQIDAIAAALATTSTTPPPPPVCGSCHTIPPATGQHDLHVNSEGLSCATCHGTGYSKTAVNAATHQNGVVNIASGSTPGWNPTTRSCSNSCHGTHNWGGTASTTPPPSGGTGGGAIDGAALYGQYCQTCHGALASSGHRGATVAQIQTGINTISGMMSLSTLTSAQLQAISDALNSTSSTPPSTTPPPPPVCGSCHTIPPATGHHSTHQSRSCSVCHGSGYSSTTVNSATHQNGVVNIASGSTPGWNPTTRSCSNSCHSTERW